ncbi:MAG: molecular chaperone TorD family protein [bacterium]|nr:molecular chaperone TorD family protein [bacterium]
MTNNQNHSPIIFSSFSKLLDYPTPAHEEAISCLLGSESSLSDDSVTALRPFADWFQTTPLLQREEIYSSLFDIDPRCTPLLSIHLFGEEDYRRGEFMVKLGELYEVYGTELGSSLPDHIAVVVGFAAKLNFEEREDLFHHCLRTPLSKMLPLVPDDHPYRSLLHALSTIVTVEMPKEALHV